MLRKTEKLYIFQEIIENAGRCRNAMQSFAKSLRFVVFLLVPVQIIAIAASAADCREKSRSGG